MRAVLLFILVLVGGSATPFATAWNWDTHPAIAESAYYRLDDSLREKLSLDLIKEGSIMPDKVFHDFTKHGFPRALPEAERWLRSTREFLNKQQYDNASLSFGIASHYITDSFAAPHSISGEPYPLHQLYEKQAAQNYFYAECTSESFELGDVLYTGSQQGKTWGEWTDTRDAQLPQLAVRDATFYLTGIAMETFNSTCRSFATHFETPERHLDISHMAFALAVLACLLFTILSLYRDLKNNRE
mgnify:CR=1 FL=1